MVTSFSITPIFLNSVRIDLAREIPREVDAFERVGFVFAKLDDAGNLQASFYHGLNESDYLERPYDVGVCYSGDAILQAQLRTMRTNEAFFTVHCHIGRGLPYPSLADLKSESELVQSFLRVRDLPHGSIILREDDVLIRFWDLNDSKFCQIENVLIENKEVL